MTAVADWLRREIITRHVEYAVPAGSAIAELEKATGAAWVEFCRLTGRDPQHPTPSDDWARVDVSDDEVVIRFEAPAAGGAS